MFTNCPECGTVFRISTTELRVAEGYVRCGHCGATFNALATLADQLPPTVTLQQLTLPTDVDQGAAVDTTTMTPEAGPEVAVPGLPTEPERPAAPPELEAAATYVPLPVSEDPLEFDIPADNWSNFFAGNNPEQPSGPASAPAPEVAAKADVGRDIGSDTVDQAGLYRALASEVRDAEPGNGADWQSLLAEVPDDEVSAEPVYVISEDTPREAPPAAPLPTDFAVDLPGDPNAEPGGVAFPEPEPQLRTADRPFLWTLPAAPGTPGSGWGWAYTGGSALLALMLVMQVLHQQRDELATNPVLTEPLQRMYAALGLPLWPAWDLQAYQVRSSEAVADRSSRGALDILARIAVVGDKPVGLPFVRVTLRDGLARPVGSRVFRPGEYLGKTPRPREPVSPGTLIPVEIRLKDPGRDALGFDVDVCVMSRREGLLCRAEREPFSP
ncbi:MAG: DUF3426 domain-containing protein [Gammaproteobacteria bacterium]|nr:DUF3426 domain-containing protein [Gammaproteobacteria bacterium]